MIKKQRRPKLRLPKLKENEYAQIFYNFEKGCLDYEIKLRGEK